MEKKTHIVISEKLAMKLKKFAFNKHKSGYGSIKKEAEAAISAHLKEA